MTSIRSILGKRLRSYVYIISDIMYKFEHNWSIGIFHGTSPFNLLPVEDNGKAVLTANDAKDIPAAFVGDPFMIRANDRWYMFFEIYNTKYNKGEIAYATSYNGLTWNYEKRIISEKYHLSYPYILQLDEEYYIIPETISVHSVQLYKALYFPTNWIVTDTLLKGEYVDSSIFYYNNKWWLFSFEVNEQALLLFYSDELRCPWVKHPKNPIIKGNPHKARPAGRVILLEGRIFRYAQDCYPEYGKQVYAFEIIELTPSTYEEKIVSE